MSVVDGHMWAQRAGARLWCDARGHDDLLVAGHLAHDGRDLLGRLAGPKHDLGEARALRPPGVQLGLALQHLP